MRLTSWNRVLAGGAAGLLALAGGIGSSPAHAADDATLTVVHAVPDLTVDVWVDGERTIDDFESGTLSDGLKLPAGTYSVAITAGDAENDDDPAIGPVDLELGAGGNYSAVAHLNADGDPTATLFNNDVSRTEAGQGRLTVRHTAAAPAVDVLANDEVAVSGVTNPNQQVLNLPAGTISAAVAAAGTTEPVIGPADVEITEGTNTIVYAWGSLEDENLELAVQQISGLENAPAGVPAGDGGAVTGSAAPVAAAAVLGALAVAVVVRRRLQSVHAKA